MANQIFIACFVLCLAWQAHAAVNCTAAGRFADPADATCQNYTLCVLSTTTGTFVAYNYVCPTTTLFNPLTSQCTAPTNYVCPATTTNTTTSVCTVDGFIADPTSTNCSSYIECVSINNTFAETTYTCPDTTFYNPTTTLCEPDYICTTPTPVAFNCTAVGRFADTTDTTCQNYFYCVLLTNNSFVQYNYTCPSTSLFNPTTSLCTATYTCTNT